MWTCGVLLHTYNSHSSVLGVLFELGGHWMFCSGPLQPSNMLQWLRSDYTILPTGALFELNAVTWSCVRGVAECLSNIPMEVIVSLVMMAFASFIPRCPSTQLLPIWRIVAKLKRFGSVWTACFAGLPTALATAMSRTWSTPIFRHERRMWVGRSVRITCMLFQLSSRRYFLRNRKRGKHCKVDVSSFLSRYWSFRVTFWSAKRPWCSQRLVKRRSQEWSLEYTSLPQNRCLVELTGPLLSFATSAWSFLSEPEL